MRIVLENLIKEVKAVIPRPPKALAAAIKAAEKRIEEVDAQPQLNQLAKELAKWNHKSTIVFTEDSDPENKYAIGVQTKNTELLRFLARISGCPIRDYPEKTDTYFEAGDQWHGRGRINLRDLADELIRLHGEFFDVEYTVAELKKFKLKKK